MMPVSPARRNPYFRGFACALELSISVRGRAGPPSSNSLSPDPATAGVDEQVQLIEQTGAEPLGETGVLFACGLAIGPGSGEAVVGDAAQQHDVGVVGSVHRLAHLLVEMRHH
jgi:hypothetical protein